MTTKTSRFETNDMVFVYNPEGRSSSDKTGKITYWFAKKDPKRMLQEEIAFLRKLNTQRLIENWKVPKYHLQRVQTEQKDLIGALDSILSWLREKRQPLSSGAL